jgi:hypothetical protein
MAQRTVIRLVDDLDGTEIVDGVGETVTFAVDGRRYEIDLTTDHATEMRTALDRYVRAGRQVGGRQRRARSAATVAKTAPHVDYSLRPSALGPRRTRLMSRRAAASRRASSTGSAPPATDTQDGREDWAEWLGPPASPLTARATDRRGLRVNALPDRLRDRLRCPRPSG